MSNIDNQSKQPTPQSSDALFRNHFPELSIESMDIYFGRQCELEIVRTMLPLMEGTLLDIGCGRMPYKGVLTSAPSRLQKYIGMDIYNEAYQTEIKPDIFWDGHTIPLPDSSVDRSLATSVFEHIPDPLPAMKEARRVLKSNGVMLLTVPFLWPLHDAPNDFHRFTPFMLDKILRKAGFGDVLIRPMGGWNAAFAQMIGLWINRSGLQPDQRKNFGEKFVDLYQNLLLTDQLPKKYSSKLIFPGLAALAFSGVAPAPEIAGFHKRGLVSSVSSTPQEESIAKPIKYLHLFPGRNHHHVPDLISVFWKNADQMETRPEDHIFLVHDDFGKLPKEIAARYTNLHIPSSNLTFVSGTLEQIIKHLDVQYPDSPIIMHSGFFSLTWSSLAKVPKVLRRIGWVMWGGDLMEMKRVSESVVEKDQQLFRLHREVIPKLGWIISCCRCKGDFDIVEQVHGICNNYSPAFYHDSGIEAQLLASRPISVNTGRKRILLGNSAAPSNNHFEAIEWLAKFKDEDVEIICPLSYGSKDDYADKVMLRGKEIFGDKFTPLTTLMDRKAYNELLDSIDVLVFNHKRQQGVGNLYYILLSGKVAYIRQDTSLADLVRENGIAVRDVEQVADMSFGAFVAPVSDEEVKANRENFLANLSREASIRSWTNLFKQYRQSLVAKMVERNLTESS